MSVLVGFELLAWYRLWGGDLLPSPFLVLAAVAAGAIWIAAWRRSRPAVIWVGVLAVVIVAVLNLLLLVVVASLPDNIGG